MKTLSLILICFFGCNLIEAQVGIGTTNPQATLDIVASNSATPSNEDGLLIPRIDDFPTTNPTATQDGMMVFATGNGTPTKGFYYWDNTAAAWQGVSGASGVANTLDQAYNQGGAGAGKNINATDGAVRINGTDGIVITGTLNAGNTINTEITGAGTRMFFNPNKGAFRAGTVLGSEWDNANIGSNSTAIGNSTTASGALSFAQGSNTTASGYGAVSLGLFSISSNNYSLATGQSTIASGINSATFGRNTRAPSYAEMAIGSFPRIYSATGVSVIDLSDRAFVIGNGTGVGALSHNAFEVWKNGRVEINEEYSLPITDGTAGQIMTTDGAGNITFQNVAAATDTDDQQIDVLNLNGTDLEISLQDDGIATQTLDLSSLSGAQRIDDLLDGKSDSDGTQDGSSIFLGINAGNADNSTDNRNIGIGFQSLNTNVTGQNNVAIGYQSLENNRGSNNIGVGNLTLNSVVATGFRNIAIGQNTQIATTTGDDNIAIGDNAMAANTLARFNVAVGTRALTTTTTNGQNTAIGHESLTANTGGTNTAVGYESLTANTTGVENVALGHQAGVSNTGDGNIFIGKSAGAQETTANNKLYIENSNANADNALIYGEFDTNILRTNGELQISNPSTSGYAFPLADGTAGQVLTTNGAGQIAFTNTSNDWSIIGNAGTNSSSNFLGTTDAQELRFRTNNNLRMGLTLKGQLELFNGSNSLFVGEEAGENDNLTDNRNTFIGYQNGFTTTNGEFNTSIGYQAMYNNTFGSTNMAVGNRALYFNTTGSNNVGVGFRSLYFNNTGENNVGLGFNSNYSNSTGNNNTVMGTRALIANQDGSDNVVIGNTAGDSDTTSNRNVYVGAGAGGGNLASGIGTPEIKEGNVFLGYNSGFQEAGSNKLYIENSIADANNALIYGEFDNNILRTNGELQINNPAGTGYAFPTADGTTNQVLTTDGAGQLSFQAVTGDGTGTDDQQIDAFFLSGTTLALSLEHDGVATQTLDLSPISGAQEINDLTDGRTGFNTVFLGPDAGTNDSLGRSNTGVGAGALESNTNGNRNTAVGYRTLHLNNTGGDDNTAMGNAALISNTNGSNNTAIGSLALNRNTTGFSNVAIGTSSLGNNTVGNNNIALGSSTLRQNTIGDYNTAMGSSALFNNISGNSNLALGRRALYDNTFGSSNLAIGNRTLANNTNGESNIAIGISSMFTNTSGDNNTAIGRSSLSSNSIGSGNVAIGHQSGYNETGSDKLYIENSNSSTPLIYGTFDTDEVGINWNSTIALPNTLSVNGNASKTTAGAWLANSDARLKTDIKTMDSQEMLNKVLAMRGVTYTWNDDKTGLDRPESIQYGFIAQDLQKIWPTKVSEDGQGYLQTAYGDYDAMFVEAFKAQQAQIETLKEENKLLTEKLKALESLEKRILALEKK